MAKQPWYPIADNILNQLPPRSSLSFQEAEIRLTQARHDFIEQAELTSFLEPEVPHQYRFANPDERAIFDSFNLSKLYDWFASRPVTTYAEDVKANAYQG